MAATEVGRTVVAQSAPTSPELPTFQPDPPDSIGEGLEIVQQTIGDLWAGFVANIPFIVVALVILAVGFVLAGYAVRAFASGMRRSSADELVSLLGQRVVRILVVLLAVLIALSVAGIEIGAALATLGLVGVAVALALQTTLANFIAGVLLLVRKPFSIGDQIRTVDEIEGTVTDLNLRVTILMTYDNEQVLVPNDDVLSNPLVNLTRKGNRRSRVAVGIDYRDDHNAVPDLLAAAVTEVEGVLPSPTVLVVCTELGDSAVVFDVMYWTDPHIGQVVRVKDRVLRACKDAVEEAGMTIPWPIRTLSVDGESAHLLERRPRD